MLPNNPKGSQDSISNEAISEIQGIMDHKSLGSKRTKKSDVLFIACEMVAQASGIKLTKYFYPQDIEKNVVLYLTELAHISSFRFRKVTLTRNWWQYDNGPLLGFLKEGGTPVALIPDNHNRYWLIDPKSKRKHKLSQQLADQIEPEAIYFYPLLAEKPLNLKMIYQFVTFRLKKEIRLTILLQIIITLAGFLPSIMIGVMYEKVIPNRDISLLFEIMIALLLNAAIVSALSFSQLISLFRVRLKTNARLQPAIWDRLLNLPTRFFQRFKVGDLANRVSSIDYSQQEMSISVSMLAVNGLISFLAIGLLFYFNVTLAVLFFVLLTLVTIVYFFTLRIQVKYQRKIARLRGKQSGFLYQVFSSISKIRVANVHKEIFDLWLDLFLRRTRQLYKSNLVGVFQLIFNASFGVLALTTFFIAVLGQGANLSFSMFIILNSIFSQLFISIFGLLSATGQIIQIIPFIERVKPILKAVPEKTAYKQKKMLSVGEIEFRNLSFRYHADSNWILNNISMVIKPQEWTSILGDSGAGKSTLYRLLLGFEVPVSGDILYDGTPMSQIDLNYLRSQIGVVMQTSTLMPGTIMENIIGVDRQLSEEDAWNLASLACIDDEIRAMPMNMNTLIIEAGKAISYGQKQRILIARALSKKPKILILDEAMGSLDNATTVQLTKSLEGFGITIISSTHRLEISKQTSVFQLLNAKFIRQNKK